MRSSTVLNAHCSDSIQKAAANGMERNVELIFHGKEKHEYGWMNSPLNTPRQFLALTSKGAVFEDNTPVFPAQTTFNYQEKQRRNCLYSTSNGWKELVYTVENSVKKTVCSFWLETVIYTWGGGLSAHFQIYRSRSHLICAIYQMLAGIWSLHSSASELNVLNLCL